MYKGKSVAVIVPAYNEEKLIGEVIRRVPAYVDRVFIVDDCSCDDTSGVAVRLSSMNSGHIRVIRHPRNCGVGGAIVTGYRASLNEGVDVAVVMAGDNQMDPLQLPKLLDPLVENRADYAVGDRLSLIKHQKGMSNWRRFGNFLLKWLTRIAALNMSITDPQNGYTAVTRQALLKLASLGRPSPSPKTGQSSFPRTVPSGTVVVPEESRMSVGELGRREDLTGNSPFPGLDAIYPRYGYCNDMLVKFSGAGARICQVPMPAVYGEEKSKIRYYTYIPKVSWLLLKGFVWRVGRIF